VTDWRYQLGDEAVTHASKYGVMLDDYQADGVRETFLVDDDGQYAHDVVCDAQPRQNGKGETLQTVALYGADILGERTFHTAQALPTAEDAFARADVLRDHPYLSPKVHPIYKNGGKSFEFGTSQGGDNVGAVFYRARSPKAGRGIPNVSRVIYDEAQHLNRAAMAGSAPTTLTAEFAQIMLSGSGALGAGSEVWWEYRRAGILHNAGLVESPGLLWRETTAETWTIDPDTFEIEFHTPDPFDRANWYLANKALGTRITEKRMAGMITKLGVDGFLQECLNVWTPLPDKGSKNSKLSPAVWADAVDVESSVHSGLVLAVDADWDGASAVISVAGRRSDGSRHVGVVASAPGIAWVEARLKAVIQELEADHKRPLKIGYDSTGPAKVLEPMLKKATAGPIELVAVSGSAYAAACAGFANGVADRGIRHRGDIETTTSVHGARVRRYGTGEGWLWHAASGVNVSPLRCATVAAWVAELVPVRVSAYEDV